MGKQQTQEKSESVALPISLSDSVSAFQMLNSNLATMGPGAIV